MPTLHEQRAHVAQLVEITEGAFSWQRKWLWIGRAVMFVDVAAFCWTLSLIPDATSVYWGAVLGGCTVHWGYAFVRDARRWEGGWHAYLVECVRVRELLKSIDQAIKEGNGNASQIGEVPGR